MERVVVVTGTSNGGIGSALAKEFANQPNTKVYACGRKRENLSELEEYGNIEIVLMDVNDSATVKLRIQEIVEKSGKIDILVNNAGVPCIGALCDQPLEKVRSVFETNVVAVLNLCQIVAPLMAKRKKGRIMNVGSIVSDIATPWAGIYSSSKSAVAAITDALAMELKPFGIEVCLIQPGAIKSLIGANGLKGIYLPEEGSMFSPFKDAIIKRVNSSQGSHSTPTDVFARRVVSVACSTWYLPRRLRYGTFTTLFWVLTFFPLALPQFILSVMYGLRKTISD